MSQREVTPVTLEGERVRLEPIEARHAADLARAGWDPEIWRWLSVAPPTGAEEEVVEWFGEWIAWSRECMARDGEVVFATVRKGTGEGGRDEAVGSTRLMNVRAADRGLEIGWTWLGRRAQRTAVNTEAKLLMLTHAFEALGMARVEFKTDSENARSRAALARLGAKFEGVRRAHLVRRDGTMRDSAYYSVVAEEWAEVKERLRGRLRRGHG